MSEKPWYTTPRSSIVGQAVMCGDALIAAVASGERNATRIASVPRMECLLRKALPAIIELHVHGIGCPECPEGTDTATRPQACPFIRQIECVLDVIGIE